MGSVVVADRLSCSIACGIFLDQRSNPCLLYWQADSYPLRHQGSPSLQVLISWFLSASFFFADDPPALQGSDSLTFCGWFTLVVLDGRTIIAVVQLLSHVRFFVTPWTAAGQASLSFTIFQSLLKLMSIESVMPSNHLILCLPFLLRSIFPHIRIFSNELALHIRWLKYWSFSFSISPSNECSDWFPLGLTNSISFQSKGLSRVFFNTTVQKHQFFSAQSSLWCNSHIHTWLLEKP